jgi:hypothetical protein
MNDTDFARNQLLSFVTTIFLVLSILVILVRARTPAMKLLLIGVFMAIAASVQSSIFGGGLNPQQVVIATGIGSSPLMKIAVILTLSGVGMMFMAYFTPPIPASASTSTAKEHPHVD